eukprot:TRINITY_DN9792_c0_g1_i5.p1 TRINITY_DN9792_c0_g1~~TRINITY_DN9792_c0_g1_i5.p1  ORF type:complete len:210 (+),score=3.77 TRINITY_DN9792_c0_g1_i5:188-817(+)
MKSCNIWRCTVFPMLIIALYTIASCILGLISTRKGWATITGTQDSTDILTWTFGWEGDCAKAPFINVKGCASFDPQEYLYFGGVISAIGCVIGSFSGAIMAVVCLMILFRLRLSHTKVNLYHILITAQITSLFIVTFTWVSWKILTYGEFKEFQAAYSKALNIELRNAYAFNNLSTAILFLVLSVIISIITIRSRTTKKSSKSTLNVNN